MKNSPLTDDEQFQALNVIEYLMDLFTAAGKENFTRTEILVVLNAVRNDPEIFDPAVLVAQQGQSTDISSHPS